MAASYRLSSLRRALNALGRGLLGVGLGPPRTALLTVPGAFPAEAPRHPVFRIMPASATSESTRTSPGRSR